MIFLIFGCITLGSFFENTKIWLYPLQKSFKKTIFGKKNAKGALQQHLEGLRGLTFWLAIFLALDRTQEIRWEPKIGEMAPKTRQYNIYVECTLHIYILDKCIGIWNVCGMPPDACIYIIYKYKYNLRCRSYPLMWVYNVILYVNIYIYIYMRCTVYPLDMCMVYMYILVWALRCVYISEDRYGLSNPSSLLCH